MSIASAKMPLVVVSSLICLCAGVAGGVVLTAFYDFRLNDKKIDSPQGPIGSGGGGGAPKGGGGAMKGGAPKGEGMGKGGEGMGKGSKGGETAAAKGKGGEFPPPPGPPPAPSADAKQQLTQLVGKLAQLTGKPLSVELNADQKKQASELLKGLDALEDLSQEEAKKRFDDLLKIVESQKATLEAAGFSWPKAVSGGAFQAPGLPLPNPFKWGATNEQFKALMANLGK